MALLGTVGYIDTDIYVLSNARVAWLAVQTCVCAVMDIYFCFNFCVLSYIVDWITPYAVASDLYATHKIALVTNAVADTSE